MGHVPSREFISTPFIVDLTSSKSGRERLAAVALCKENFPSKDHPLFRKFLGVRADTSVRYWYCAANDNRDQIPDAPSEDYVYQKFVEDPSSVLDLNLPVESWIPMPIVLVRFDDPTTTEAPNGDNCSVVGYYGCRFFGSNGSVGDEAVVGVFLGNRFHNEAKSLAIIEIACKTYDHFCKKAGLHVVPWPRAYHHLTKRDNLPCLRLMQKLHFMISPAVTDPEKVGLKPADIDHDGVMIDIQEDNVAVRLAGRRIAVGCEILASRVRVRRPVTNPPIHYMRPEADPPPVGNAFGETLQIAIDLAKKNWSSSNAIVNQSLQLQRVKANRTAIFEEKEKTDARAKAQQEFSRKEPPAGATESSVSIQTSQGKGAVPQEELVASPQLSPRGGPPQTNQGKGPVPQEELLASPQLSPRGVPPQGQSLLLDQNASSRVTSHTASRRQSGGVGIADASTTSDYIIGSAPASEVSETQPYGRQQPLQQQQQNYDNLIWLGDMCPLYMLDSYGKWVHFFWADAGVPFRLSEWQPHEQFRSLEPSREGPFQIYHSDFQRGQFMPASPIVFVETGEYAWQYHQGRYRSVRLE